MEHSNNNNFREQCGCVTQSVSTHKASMPRQLMHIPRLYVLLQVTWLPGCLFLLCSSNWADMMMPCAPWITVSNMNYFSSACLFFYMYISYLRKGWLSRDIVVTTPLFGSFWRWANIIISWYLTLFYTLRIWIVTVITAHKFQVFVPPSCDSEVARIGSGSSKHWWLAKYFLMAGLAAHGCGFRV